MASMLAKKVWFYGTWAHLVTASLVSVGFIGGLALGGVLQLEQGRYFGGVTFLIGSVVLFLMFVQGVWKFRRDVQVGMRQELQRRNCCPDCSYDLRGSEGRCPECGRMASGSEKRQAERGNDRAAQLLRRVWFYGTWAGLVVLVAMSIGMGLALVIGGVVLVVNGQMLGLCVVPGGAAMLWKFERSRRKFFRDLREGKEGELKRRNLCPHCEYDLRASEVRCPECGEAIVAYSETVEI